LSRTGAILWLHFDTPTEEEIRFLQDTFKIHHLTIEDVVHQNQRPKIEPFDDYIYIAIHPLTHSKKWQIEPSELDLLLGRHWIVSVHYGSLPGLIENSHVHERLAAALERGTDVFLYTLVDLVVDSYFPILVDIEVEIDALEDRLLAQPQAADMNRLLAFKRSLVHIRRAVGPQREVFNQLTRHEFPFIRPENQVYFRDVYDYLLRINEELESLRDILSSAMEVHLGSTSNQLNVTMKRLTAWGTIFVVITAIAGIYGINFKFMPELEWRYGYFAAIGAMFLISLGLYFYFHRKGYF
jgi:magnesium transporter